MEQGLLCGFVLFLLRSKQYGYLYFHLRTLYLRTTMPSKEDLKSPASTA